LFRSLLKILYDSLTGFFFPVRCRVCGKESENDEIICPECISLLSEKASQYKAPSRTLEYIDEIIVLLPYDKTIRKLIHDLKYRGIHSLGIILGKLMAVNAVFRYPPDILPFIVPVPLHTEKLKSRGYNQSKCLADGIASVTGYPVNQTFIIRSRFTGTQTALTHENRKSNVSGAFVFTGHDALNGCPVIIADDVLTTGSTVSECAKILKEHGAGKITVMVAATPEIDED